MKYKFTGETKEFCGMTLNRIQRISDGLIGGWIEREENLSQDGDCFVCGNAWVGGNAWVYGNARVSDDARVYGNAWVGGNARVSDDARVYGNAWVYGNAAVYKGNATKCLHVQQELYSITATNDRIFIGCEGHTWGYWRDNIKQLGKKHRYSDLEIKQVWVLLNVLCEQISGVKLKDYKGD